MKASASPLRAIGLLIALGLTVPWAAAQDAVVLKNGQRREGQIVGLAGDQLKIKIGPVETSLPMAQVASVRMDAPKQFDDALATWKQGDAAKTLPILEPLVEKFRGLPTPWATRASALLGEVYLAGDQTAKAEAAFAAFQKAYPDSTDLAGIGLARLAVAKKDFAGAKQRLEPIVAEADKTLAAAPDRAAAYGQAYYLMGMVREAEGAQPEALRDYLSAVSIFHEDEAVAAKAQERANALIDKKVIVP